MWYQILVISQKIISKNTRPPAPPLIYILTRSSYTPNENPLLKVLNQDEILGKFGGFHILYYLCKRKINWDCGDNSLGHNVVVITGWWLRKNLYKKHPKEINRNGNKVGDCVKIYIRNIRKAVSAIGMKVGDCVKIYIRNIEVKDFPFSSSVGDCVKL